MARMWVWLKSICSWRYEPHLKCRGWFKDLQWKCKYRYMHVRYHMWCWNHLRNEFNFWKVHGIMNTSGLVQSKWSPKGFTLTLQETRSIHDSMNLQKVRASLTLHETRSIYDSMNLQKLNLLLIFTFYIISQVSIFNSHLTLLVFQIFWIKLDIT